jgi:hypothetical protein
METLKSCFFPFTSIYIHKYTTSSIVWNSHSSFHPFIQIPNKTGVSLSSYIRAEEALRTEEWRNLLSDHTKCLVIQDSHLQSSSECPFYYTVCSTCDPCSGSIIDLPPWWNFPYTDLLISRHIYHHHEIENDMQYISQILLLIWLINNII